MKKHIIKLKKLAGTLKRHSLVYYANFMTPTLHSSPAATNLSDVASYASNYVDLSQKKG